MEKKVTILRSFEEADRHDKEYYRSLTPMQRLEILMELNRRYRESVHADPSGRPERVYRIVQFQAKEV